eukprot:12367165-Alexandrium_andersonii.AAC.1
MPDWRTWMQAWLSSPDATRTSRPRTWSRSIWAGIARARKTWSRATISASGVLCDTAVCFLETVEGTKR